MLNFNLDLNTTAVATIPPAPVGRPRELLTPLPTPGHYLLVLDNTACEKFTTCPRAASYYLVHKREAHAKNAALIFGGAIHKGLERLALGGTVEEACAEVSTYFLENPAPPDDYRTVGNAVEIIRQYDIHTTLAPDYQQTILRDKNDKPIVEQPFELPLGVIELDAQIQLPQWDSPRHVIAVHVAWSGRMDELVFTNEQNRVLDHKTSSIDGDQFIQDFQLSNQVLGYVWAAQQLYPEHNVSSFCLNVIRFKKPVANVGLTQKGPRGGEPALRFFRAYFQYTPDRVAEWANNTLAIVEDFIYSLSRNYFPLHTKWCFGKYGRCSYHDICTIDDQSMRVRLLNTEAFKDVTWNPTN